MFVLDPSGQGLLLMGSTKALASANWWSIAEVTLTAALGIAALAAGFQGWALKKATPIERSMLLVAGFALVYPAGGRPDRLRAGGRGAGAAVSAPLAAFGRTRGHLPHGRARALSWIHAPLRGKPRVPVCRLMKDNAAADPERLSHLNALLEVALAIPAHERDDWLRTLPPSINRSCQAAEPDAGPRVGRDRPLHAAPGSPSPADRACSSTTRQPIRATSVGTLPA